MIVMFNHKKLQVKRSKVVIKKLGWIVSTILSYSPELNQKICSKTK